MLERWDERTGNRIEPQKDQGFLGIDIDIIQLRFDKSLRVQINVDSKQVCYLIVAVIVNISKVGKEETSNVTKLAPFWCAGIVVNGLSLFKTQRSTHCFVVAVHWFDKATLIEELPNAKNNRTIPPQKVRKWADESKSPEKIGEGDVAERISSVKKN